MGHFGQTPPTAQTIFNNANVRSLEAQIEETTKSIAKIDSEIIGIVKNHRDYWKQLYKAMLYWKKGKADPVGIKTVLDYINSSEPVMVFFPTKSSPFKNLLTPFSSKTMAKSTAFEAQYTAKLNEKTTFNTTLAELKDKLLIEQDRAEKEKIRIENELAKANAPKMNKGLIAGVAALGVAAYLYSQD